MDITVFIFTPQSPVDISVLKIPHKAPWIQKVSQKQQFIYYYRQASLTVDLKLCNVCLLKLFLVLSLLTLFCGSLAMKFSNLLSVQVIYLMASWRGPGCPLRLGLTRTGINHLLWVSIITKTGRSRPRSRPRPDVRDQDRDQDRRIQD